MSVSGKIKESSLWLPATLVAGYFMQSVFFAPSFAEEPEGVFPPADFDVMEYSANRMKAEQLNRWRDRWRDRWDEESVLSMAQILRREVSDPLAGSRVEEFPPADLLRKIASGYRRAPLPGYYPPPNVYSPYAAPRYPWPMQNYGLPPAMPYSGLMTPALPGPGFANPAINNYNYPVNPYYGGLPRPGGYGYPRSMPQFGYNPPPWNFSRMSPLGNTFSPNQVLSNNMPMPWKNPSQWYPWNNSSMPFFPASKKKPKEKKAWGDERNIWPDFYTDFTDNFWDNAINAPFDVGRMPGGWRAPSFSSPDPVTVGDAVTNQFPPMIDEMGNMMDFSD